ncbi:hypothetical protein BDP27DRAFT_1404801 [Rhodocollybia butyracea]|uniref:Uncharacterized protein n=1 Tax=Rhodocollybia butyracea TaxID=206335 RepID=A0A9P5PLB4_9AGAR|nr:hypothetical protein BDP27DRAFT_1404801 [Rhodocollybia butyracea]
MTEYDYSPEAAERYQAKLHSIGRWVHETERYEPVNPFVLSPAAASARLPMPGGSDGSSSRHRPHRYPNTSYPYPVSPQAPGPYPPPQRSHTFPIPPPPPPPLPRPKRSNTSGGYGSPDMIYDPRVGTASRHVFTTYQTQPQSPSKRWFGKLFSGLRSSSPSRAQSPSSVTETQSRHSRSKSGITGATATTTDMTTIDTTTTTANLADTIANGAQSPIRVQSLRSIVNLAAAAYRSPLPRNFPAKILLPLG